MSDTLREKYGPKGSDPRPKGIIKLPIKEARLVHDSECKYCLQHIEEAVKRGQNYVLYNMEDFHILSPDEVEAGRRVGRL